MARVGCRIFTSVRNALSRRSLTTANCSPWKNIAFPLSLKCNAKSVVAVDTVSQMQSVKWNKSYYLRTLSFPELTEKLVPTSQNIENRKIKEILPEKFIIQCPTELLIPLIEIEVPPFRPPLEKLSAWLVVIRRQKMKRHKLRKLRKRMKFEWAKRRQKKELRKEKKFQAMLVDQIKEAEKFSAEEYVAMKLKKAYDPDIPQKNIPQLNTEIRQT